MVQDAQEKNEVKSPQLLRTDVQDVHVDVFHVGLENLLRQIESSLTPDTTAGPTKRVKCYNPLCASLLSLETEHPVKCPDVENAQTVKPLGQIDFLQLFGGIVDTRRNNAVAKLDSVPPTDRADLPL